MTKLREWWTLADLLSQLVRIQRGWKMLLGRIYLRSLCSGCRGWLGSGGTNRFQMVAATVLENMKIALHNNDVAHFCGHNGVFVHGC